MGSTRKRSRPCRNKGRAEARKNASPVASKTSIESIIVRVIVEISIGILKWVMGQGGVA